MQDAKGRKTKVTSQKLMALVTMVTVSRESLQSLLYLSFVSHSPNFLSISSLLPCCPTSLLTGGQKSPASCGGSN